jgi:hypothetical protein
MEDFEIFFTRSVAAEAIFFGAVVSIFSTEPLRSSLTR